MRFRVEIRRRRSIADPEGATVRKALAELGFAEVTEVRFGRTLEVDLDADDPGAARERVDEMCRRLLANPVMEDYDILQVEER